MSGEPLGPSADLPFALVIYPPKSELSIRRETGLLATRLQNDGRRAHIVDLGALMWECLARHPMGPDGLAESEQMIGDLGPVLAEAGQLLAGNGEAALEGMVLEKLRPLDPDRDVLFLIGAAALFPVYRTSSLLERLVGHVQRPAPTVLFYPGRLHGVAQPSFMDVLEPSPRYRATIIEC